MGSRVVFKAHGDEVRENKLYVGNLDSRLTEFHLVKLFSKYGPIKHFDYLWYNSGPKKGQPRGYCFVEFIKHEDALAAHMGLDGKLALGRPLTVKFAEHHLDRKQLKEKQVQEALGSASLNNAPPSQKIAAIQAKLAAMQGKEVPDDVQLKALPGYHPPPRPVIALPMPQGAGTIGGAVPATVPTAKPLGTVPKEGPVGEGIAVAPPSFYAPQPSSDGESKAPAPTLPPVVSLPVAQLPATVTPSTAPVSVYNTAIAKHPTGATAQRFAPY